MTVAPMFSMLMRTHDVDDALLRGAINSLIAQCYPHPMRDSERRMLEKKTRAGDAGGASREARGGPDPRGDAALA